MALQSSGQISHTDIATEFGYAVADFSLNSDGAVILTSLGDARTVGVDQVAESDFYNLSAESWTSQGFLMGGTYKRTSSNGLGFNHPDYGTTYNSTQKDDPGPAGKIDTAYENDNNFLNSPNGFGPWGSSGQRSRDRGDVQNLFSNGFPEMLTAGSDQGLHYGSWSNGSVAGTDNAGELLYNVPFGGSPGPTTDAPFDGFNGFAWGFLPNSGSGSDILHRPGWNTLHVGNLPAGTYKLTFGISVPDTSAQFWTGDPSATGIPPLNGSPAQKFASNGTQAMEHGRAYRSGGSTSYDHVNEMAVFRTLVTEGVTSSDRANYLVRFDNTTSSQNIGLSAHDPNRYFYPFTAPGNSSNDYLFNTGYYSEASGENNFVFTLTSTTRTYVGWRAKSRGTNADRVRVCYNMGLLELWRKD